MNGLFFIEWSYFIKQDDKPIEWSEFYFVKNNPTFEYADNLSADLFVEIRKLLKQYGSDISFNTSADPSDETNVKTFGFSLISPNVKDEKQIETAKNKVEKLLSSDSNLEFIFDCNKNNNKVYVELSKRADFFLLNEAIPNNNNSCSRCKI